MQREFQANAFFKVNGIEVKMVSNAEKKLIFVRTENLKTRQVVDADSFSYEDPADVAAAFAKYSNAVTWAVMHEEDTSIASVNGM